MVPPLLFTSRMRIALAMLFVSLGACTESATTTPDDPQDPVSPTAVFLSPAQHLSRASMALRGMRPSVEDLRAVAADPDALPGIVDRYLASPEFGATIRELHNETLLVRVEQPQMTYPNIGPLATKTAREINDGLFEEPLRLIENIVMTDQPYTNIVTADYTMTNAVTAAIWGIAHTGGATAWTKSMYTDGRPAAGILSTSAFHNRWRSTGFNFNRGRTNEVSRALLCHDFLASDIQIDTSVDLSDPDVVANAVIANKSCAGCHQTLDPLASYLFIYRGQLAPVGVDAYPVTYYQPGQINRWKTANKRPPMFFGIETGGMTGLGDAIASDPRFAKCTATRFASYMSEVPQNQLSGAWIARLQKALVASDWNAKALAKAIVLSDEFRISHDTDEARAERLVGTLKVRPEQLQRMLRGITGFDWSTVSTLRLRGIPYGEANLLESDFIGFRVLAGGIDSYFVTDPVHTMNATSSLVAKTAAASAADFVVEHDRTAAVADRTLFVAAAVGATDEASIRAQLAHLHASIYGELVAADSPEVDETLALYNEAFAETSDRARAWKLTLVGMLSDFRSLFY
jgi:hypothetical protein